ncbi:MAG: thermonuclease family protein [Alphaproteobacteria bacterium]
MVALSVLLGVGLLFWIWGLFSIVPASPHYPKPGLGQFWAHWAENETALDQPLTLFTTILFLLSAYLFVLFITQRGTWHNRRLAERTALGAGFILIAGMVMVTDDLIDLVTGQYRLDKWEETPFGAHWLIGEELVEAYDPDARFWAKIGTEWVFLPDADTLRFGANDYRLWGIDALQTEQICVAANKETKRVHCGKQAREALLKLMNSVPPSKISCRFPDQAHYPRTISCRAGGQDVAEFLVRQGYAFPIRTGWHRYRDARRAAIADNAGAWGTTFLYPWRWKRAANCAPYAVCLNYYLAD